MNPSDEEGHGRHVPQSLLVVCASRYLAAICEGAVRGLDGVDAHHLTDPRAALAWANQHDLAGVIVDNELPGMDAAWFIGHLAVVPDRPRPHVILVCEGTPHDIPPGARNAGVDDIVTKPVSPEWFAELVRSALTLRLAESADRPRAGAVLPEPPPPTTAPLDPAQPTAPPADAPSRRRGVMRWLLLALLLLLLFVGCYRYREVIAGGRRPAATPTPTPTSLPSVPERPANPGAAALFPAVAPIGMGAAETPAARRATPPPAGSSTAGDASDASAASAASGAGSGASPSAQNGAAGRSLAARGAALPGEGTTARVDAVPARASGAGTAPQQPASVPAGAPAASPSAAAPQHPGAPAGGAAAPAAGGAAAAVAAAASPAAAGGAAHAAGKAAAGGAAGAAKPQAAPGSGGFLVLDAAGHSVAESQPDVARAPASTIKVLTAAVALATLGAQQRFLTQLIAQGGVRDGAIDGSLALVGGGDPVLTSADIDAAAAALERRGVREVRGDVVIDATAFELPEHNPHWTAADRAEPYGAGTSAVSLDEGTRVERVGGVLVSQTIADQQAYAGSVLAARLRAHHIAIDGSVRAGRSGGGTVLWTHESPPLAALIRTMLIESDNHIAEHVLRAIGLAASGVGSEAAGIAAMRAYLAQHDIRADGLQLYDGSGLSQDDRATPRMLATLMWRIAGTPEGDIIHASLTPAGNRPGQSVAEGFIRVKTGRAGTARGIVGSVDRGAQGALSFAYLDTVGRAASPAARQASEETELHRLAQITP